MSHGIAIFRLEFSVPTHRISVYKHMRHREKWVRFGIFLVFNQVDNWRHHVYVPSSYILRLKCLIYNMCVCVCVRWQHSYRVIAIDDWHHNLRKVNFTHSISGCDYVLSYHKLATLKVQRFHRTPFYNRIIIVHWFYYSNITIKWKQV